MKTITVTKLLKQTQIDKQIMPTPAQKMPKQMQKK